MSDTPTESELAALDASRRLRRSRFSEELSATAHRLAPHNLRDELIDRAIDKSQVLLEDAVDVAARHKGAAIATGTISAMAVFHRPLWRWGTKVRDYITAKIGK